MSQKHILSRGLLEFHFIMLGLYKSLTLKKPLPVTDLEKFHPRSPAITPSYYNYARESMCFKYVS